MTTETIKLIHDRVSGRVALLKQKLEEANRIRAELETAYGSDIVDALLADNSSSPATTPQRKSTIIHMPTPAGNKLNNSAPQLRHEVGKATGKSPISIVQPVQPASTKRHKKRIHTKAPGAFTALKPHVLRVLQSFPLNTKFQSQRIKDELKKQKIDFDPAHVTLLLSKKEVTGVRVLARESVAGLNRPVNVYKIIGKVSLKKPSTE